MPAILIYALVLSLLTGFQSGNKPVASVHVSGPNGLEGWTLSYVEENMADRGPLAEVLVISRKGKKVWRIQGSPLIGNWKFESNGKFVAYETGPLHWSQTCELFDLESGKSVASYDCYHEPLTNPPQWVEELKSH